jgi:hypothetical protein
MKALTQYQGVGARTQFLANSERCGQIPAPYQLLNVDVASLPYLTPKPFLASLFGMKLFLLFYVPI